MKPGKPTLRRGAYLAIGSIGLALGAYMMRRVPVGQVALAVVWLGHFILFAWGIKTVPEEGSTDGQNGGVQP